MNLKNDSFFKISKIFFCVYFIKKTLLDICQRFFTKAQYIQKNLNMCRNSFIGSSNMFAPSDLIKPGDLYISPDIALSMHPQMWPENMVGQKEKPVKAFLVDDDIHIRRVIAQDLMGDQRTLLVGQASSLREARKSIISHVFDVLLLDLNLGDGDGIDLLDFVNEKMPHVLSIVISVTEREDRVFQAFSHGAQGFLLKNSLFGDYSQAVLQVANGGASITPSLAKKILS